MSMAHPRRAPRRAGADARRRAAAVLGAAVALAGCAHAPPSALHAVGPQAQRIEQLWWWFFGVTTAVFVLVVVATALGVLRRASRASDGLAAAREPDADVERQLSFAVGSATVVATVLLAVLLLASYLTGRALAALKDAPSSPTIEAVGHHRWWRLTAGERPASNGRSNAPRW